MFLKLGKLFPAVLAGVLFVLSSAAGASGDAGGTKLHAELDAKQQAFQEARQLNDHAVAFLLAQKIYKLGKRVYPHQPALLGPLAYQYAEASVRINEPGALTLFDEALELYQKAFGENAQELIPVLAAAADEAISRNNTVKAYDHLGTLGEKLEGSPAEGGFYDAKRATGLARLYFRSGEKGRALSHLKVAKSMLADASDGIEAFDHAQALFHVAELEEHLGDLSVAAELYEASLRHFISADPKARDILSIHRRLMRLDHLLGDYKGTCTHIIDAYKFRSWALDIPAFDPSSTYSLSQLGSAVARITFRLSISSDCKAQSVEIVKAEGLTPDEVKAWLESVYLFVPDLVTGRASGVSYPVEDTWILFHAEADTG